ncbi:MAG TPA: septal ring lytic transglycosylase RlpA family protein [Candidatus Saccharimonadia bacterium]
MKAKTKRRVLHVLTKKKLVKRRTSKSVLRTFLIALSTLSVGSLAYAITVTKPTVGISVHSTAAGGVQIEAPITLNATPAPQSPNSPAANTGRGSWYAFGLPEPDALTCASRTYPRGTYLLVTNQYNNKSVVCRVNDYGPEAWTGRIIDLSRGSFSQVDNLSRGTIPVEIRIASSPTGYVSPTDTDIGVLVGYTMCNANHSGEYCDLHRQDSN